MAASMQSSDTLGDLSADKRAKPEEQPAPGRRAAGAVLNWGQAAPARQKAAPKGGVQGSCGVMWVTWDLGAVRRGVGQLLGGFRLIARSGYLCHVCLHFVLHYIVSTFFYFEKTLVVASGGGSASQRVATFATINSMSAGAVALIQLTATVQRCL